MIKHLILLKNPKCNGYQTGPASIIYKVFDKKTSGRGIKNKDISKQHPLDFTETNN